MLENFGEFMGCGCRGFGRSEFAAHAAMKRPKIAGARAETLGGHAQGATGAILDPATARGEYFAATDLIIRTESQPGGKMFVCRPFMPIEAHLCEDDMDRRGLSPRHWGKVDAGDAVEMGPEVKGRFVALRLPMRGRRWGQGMGCRIDKGLKRAEDALDFLIAVGEVLLGKVIKRQRLGEREKMFRPVIALERFGNGLRTGFDAVVPILR